MSKRLASVFCSIAWMPIASLALLASCSSLKGDQSGGRYTAPGGLFSLPVPALSMGAAVQDKSSTNPQTRLVAGSVTFHDDFGQVRSIQYEQIALELGKKLSEPASATGALRGYMSDVSLAEIQQWSPQARIVHEEPVTLSDGVPAWFAVLEIPQGSPMMETSAEHPKGRRLDSTRGFFVLCHGSLFLTLSAANDHVFALAGGQSAAQGGVDQAGMDRLKDLLTTIYASMSFG